MELTVSGRQPERPQPKQHSATPPPPAAAPPLAEPMASFLQHQPPGPPGPLLYTEIRAEASAAGRHGGKVVPTVSQKKVPLLVETVGAATHRSPAASLAPAPPDKVDQNRGKHPAAPTSADPHCVPNLLTVCVRLSLMMSALSSCLHVVHSHQLQIKDVHSGAGGLNVMEQLHSEQQVRENTL
ncbi:unnamed protein product [Pleuronectes platessa]|uniref:Uncharacterized protein n=1 Tax=Pleuronectes platessa TaxID=8262 RepID=A0A9N7UCE9_PLEPL|nr:unnamed protein product [Pleuronectes platessa]